MAAAGDVLVHPVTGETITVLAHEPERLELEDRWPAGHVVPAHRHPALAETWTVLEGAAVITVGGVAHELGPGDAVTAPAGTPHEGRNAADGETRLHLAFAPAGEWLAVVERLFAGDDVLALLRAHPDALAPP